MILEQFRQSGQHPTAVEVYERVRRKLPNISLGTVYRNLEILSQAGLITKLQLGGGQKQYDGGTHEHYHVQCVRCDRVSDIPAEPFPDLDAAADGYGFEILGHQLAFRGLCRQCRQVEETTPAGKEGQTRWD